MRLTSARVLLTSLLVVSSAGCQDGRVPWLAGWALDPVTGQVAPAGPPPAGAIAVASQAVTPAAVTGAMAPAASNGGGGVASAVSIGATLKVDLRHFLSKFQPAAHRRVLATVADIARLVLTVQQPGQPDKTATLTQSDLAAGKADFTFGQMPAGNAIVFVVAYDAAGAPIGSAAQVVVISATAAAVADMTVQLVPTAGTSGPGGSLVTTTTLIDGPVPPPPSGTVLAKFGTIGTPTDLVAGAGGSMVVCSHYIDMMTYNATGNVAAAHTNILLHVAEDGATLFKGYWPRTVPLLRAARAGATAEVWVSSPGRLIHADHKDTSMGFDAVAIASDADGNAYYVTPNKAVVRMTLAGAASTTTMQALSAIAVDRDGNVWTNWSEGATPSVRKYAPDATLLGTFPMPNPVSGLAIAPSGEVWVGHGPTNVSGYSGVPISGLTKLASNGTAMISVSASGRRLHADMDGNLWLAGATVTKFSSEGVATATYPLDATAIAVDDQGYLWAGLSNGVIEKVQP